MCLLLYGETASWKSKLQKCVALSTTIIEYIAIVIVGKEMFQIKRFLQQLNLKQDQYIIYCDSQSILDLNKNTTYYSHTKYIDMRYYWLGEMIEKQSIRLKKKIHNSKNFAYTLSKVVTYKKFNLCASLASMNFRQRVVFTPHGLKREIYWVYKTFSQPIFYISKTQPKNI